MAWADENTLRKSVPYLYGKDIKGGEVFRFISHTQIVKSHFIEATPTTKATSVLYMGNDSEAVKRGLNVSKRYYALVELHINPNPKVLIMEVPPGVVFASHEKVELYNKEKNDNPDTHHLDDLTVRDYTWQITKSDELQEDGGTKTVWGVDLVEQIKLLSPEMLERNDAILEKEIEFKEDMLRKQYYQLFGYKSPKPEVQNREQAINDF